MSKSIYQRFREVCSFGKTMAVIDHSEISFLIPRVMLPWPPTVDGFDRMRLVAQPGGLTLGFALLLVVDLLYNLFQRCLSRSYDQLTIIL